MPALRSVVVVGCLVLLAWLHGARLPPAPPSRRAPPVLIVVAPDGWAVGMGPGEALEPRGGVWLPAGPGLHPAGALTQALIGRSASARGAELHMLPGVPAAERAAAAAACARAGLTIPPHDLAPGRTRLGSPPARCVSARPCDDMEASGSHVGVVSFLPR